ncbi:hypothetical protein D3C83_228350 [compost metagenome]
MSTGKSPISKKTPVRKWKKRTAANASARVRFQERKRTTVVSKRNPDQLIA